MPKAKPSKSCHLKQIGAEFGDDIFSTDSDILYCNMCDTKVGAKKKDSQYINSNKHDSSANSGQNEICASVTATVFI
jgi:hypothetical protein